MDHGSGEYLLKIYVEQESMSCFSWKLASQRSKNHPNKKNRQREAIWCIHLAWKVQFEILKPWSVVVWFIAAWQLYCDLSPCTTGLSGQQEIQLCPYRERRHYGENAALHPLDDNLSPNEKVVWEEEHRGLLKHHKMHVKNCQGMVVTGWIFITLVI